MQIQSRELFRPGRIAGRNRLSGLRPMPADWTGDTEALATVALPEREMTPRVRAAVYDLMQEVGTLRAELMAARRRAEQMRKLADEDPLLPVANRRAFVRELSRAIALSKRHGVPNSLVYLDVDGLKRVNDGHGHAAGDAVLRHVAVILREQIRQADLVGRLGGDEFGVLLMHMGDDAAAQKACSLAEAIGAQPLAWGETELTVSVAYGHHTLSGEEEPVAALAAADRVMYAHKAAGRG